VKVGIRAKESIEYFWISPFSRANGRFSGRIDNKAELVDNVKLGDTISFGEDEIVDWLYVDSGPMKGNYTACELFRRQPKEEAQAAITLAAWTIASSDAYGTATR
jgi:uncharacterized protein YegJ (DUF2314 family)